MKIDNAKDLEALAKLCRKAGISHIEVDGMKLTFAGVEAPAGRKLKADKSDKIESTEPFSDEDYLFWSADPQAT